MTRIVLALVGLMALTTTGIAPAHALELNAQSYYIAHPQTGVTVLKKNPDEQMGPASLTKLMTLYLLFDALDRGEVSLDSELPISEKAWRKGGSKMFLEVGKKAKVEDLIRGIAVSSGNDACIVVAEYLGGTEDAFAVMMNQQAEELGMANTTFRNASGWPHPEQLTTARDMYKLATALIQNFPQYYDVFSEKEFTYSGIRQSNRNGLLNANLGVDGMKTGHIEDAGYHLVTSAKRNETRLVSVVMGADTMSAREDASAAGLAYGFRNFENFDLFKQGEVVEAAAPVWLGQADTVPLVIAEDLTLFLPNDKREGLTAEAVYDAPIKAPVKAGTQVGVVSITHPETGETKDVPLLAGANVPKAGTLDQLLTRVQHALGL